MGQLEAPGRSWPSEGRTPAPSCRGCGTYFLSLAEVLLLSVPGCLLSKGLNELMNQSPYQSACPEGTGNTLTIIIINNPERGKAEEMSSRHQTPDASSRGPGTALINNNTLYRQLCKSRTFSI